MPLSEDRHDGHAFIPEVLRRGVKGVILDRGHVEGLRASSVLNEEAACIAVDDTTKALGSMALYQRKRTGVTVTAVTGFQRQDNNPDNDIQCCSATV